MVCKPFLFNLLHSGILILYNMNNMKKVATLLLTVPILFVSACNHLLDVNINESGIENYSPGLSSVLLCAYLTLRDEHTEHFLEEYSYESAFFQYKDRIDGNISYETVLMALTYEESIFHRAYNDVKGKEGFSSQLEFFYMGYDFCLNETEKIINGEHCHTSFDFDCENKYIQWINIVGVNTAKQSLLFMGFFYANNKDILRNINKSKPYAFSSWDNLFKDFYNEFEW